MIRWSVRQLMVAGILAILVLPGSARPGQDESIGGGRGSTINGTIEIDGGGRVSERYEVIVQQVTGAGDRRVISDPTGKFYVPGMKPGTYTLSIRPSRTSQFQDASTDVDIYSGDPRTTYVVTIFLKLRDQQVLTRTPSGRLFSAQESDSSVPKEARKEYKAGVKAAHSNEAAEAVTRFRNAIRIAPDYLFALNDLGVQLTRMGQYQESAELLRKAVAIAPTSFPPHLNLAISLLGLHDVNQAQAEVKTALSIDPSAHDALFLSGTVERKLGNTDAAIDAFQKAFDAGGADAVLAEFELGQLYDSLNQPYAAAKAYKVFLQFVNTGPQADIARQRLKAMGVA
ncbi:MAG TPA: tetratricopeptide repeat protein [Blastocatellia bacterium]|nr:tetratricopeptide repeat protein [Blastocatellia bacterium]